MFLDGQLLYFKPFYFKNGNTPKNKYFIILKSKEKNTIVASLPTSINNAPSLITTYGCIDIPEKQFNCFVFAKDIPICDNEECFPRDTHVYGEQIEAYSYEQLTASRNIVVDVDYEVIGNLKSEVFESLLDCIIASNAIKPRIKKLLKD